MKLKQNRDIEQIYVKMSAGGKDLSYEAKLAEVDLAYDVQEGDGGAVEYPLSNEEKKPQLNNLTSLKTLGMGPAIRSVSLPSILQLPIKEDKLDVGAAHGLGLASEDGEHERDNLTSLGELGAKVESSATELVSCPGVVCLIKNERKISDAIGLPPTADGVETPSSPNELQGENCDSLTSESDSLPNILFLGSVLRNSLSQDQDTTRRKFDCLIKESRPDRPSQLRWDQDYFIVPRPLSPDREEGRSKTLSGTVEPGKSYESSTKDSLARPSTLCLVSQINGFSSPDKSRKKNEFPTRDPPPLPSGHNLASQLHVSLAQDSQEGQLGFPKRKMDIPKRESLAMLSGALHDEEHELNNFPCQDEPTSYDFSPRDSLGQPSVVFLSKSKTLPNNSSSFMDLSQFDTEPQQKLSKWASLKNRLIGPSFLGPRVTNTRVPEQFNGQEAGSSKENDRPPTTTLLGALSLEVPKNKKLMPWTRLKQAMLGKKNGDEDQENYQDGGQGKGDKSKGNRREKSQRMFGLGWMQKAFSVTKDVAEEVQEAKPNYPVDTYNTILDREM